MTPQPSPQPLPALVDEFGALDDHLRPFAPLVERHKQLARQIGAHFADRRPDDTFLASGARYTVTVSARARERRVVSMAKIKARFGLKRFLDLCTFPLRVLDEHIPPGEQDGLVVQARTGPRKLTVCRKFEQAA